MHQYSQYRIEKITTPFKSRLECNDNTTLRTGVALIFLLTRNMLFLNGKVGLEINQATQPSGLILCDSYRIQTCNLLIRSQMLYSVELRSHLLFAVAKLRSIFVLCNSCGQKFAIFFATIAQSADFE